MSFEPTEPQHSPGKPTQQTPIQPVEQQTPAPVTPTAKKKRAKWFLPAIIVGAVLLLAGGGSYAYFAVYMQSPENLWKSGMKNTANGLENYVNADRPMQKGGSFNGTFKLSSPTSADGAIEGKYDDKNVTLKAEAGAAGIRANLELRAITAEGATNPDVYLKLGGLKPISSLLGGYSPEISSIVTGVDDKWFSIDRTLLDGATQEISDTKMPTPKELEKEIRDTTKKMATVLSNSLFSTDDATAVVKIKETLEKEDFKGRKAQHVKVQVQKEQLKTMIRDLRATVKDTYLEKLFLEGYNMGADEVDANAPTLEELLKELDTVNFDNAVADVWIDTGLKYVRNVRITNVDKDGATTNVDFMLDYKGGDEFPLSITLAGKDATTEGSLSLGMTLNQKSNDARLSIGVDGTLEEQKVQFSADMLVKGSDETVNVEKPEGATNIMELLGGLMTQFEQLQSQFGGITSEDGLNQSSLDCASQLEEYANSGGTTPIDEACQSTDDTEL